MKLKIQKLFMLCLFGMISMGAKAADIPNNEIWYEASSKLADVTGSDDHGLHTNAFNTTITSHTFSEGRGIITFNADVTLIGDDAFFFCSGLTSVTIPNSVTSIGNYAFCYCSGLTSMTIPNSVTSIGDQAFSNCSSLTSVTIPNSVTSIGYGAFSYCKGLTSVSISDLDKWAEIEFGSPEANPLYYAHNLYINEQLVTEAKLTTAKTISIYAFYNCSGLTSVTIPNSVTSIGNYAFCYCSGLTSMTIPNSVTSVGHCAFAHCIGLTSVPIGNSVISIGRSAFEGCKSLTSVIIPNSVTSIGESAFSDCYNLTSVTIPNSVISIGSDAFEGSTSLPVENNLRYADTYLVEAVDKTLSTYNIKEDTKWIGSKAFYDCKNLTSIEIPNSVTSIGNSAFWNCSGLTSIEIPNSVTSIGSGAFQSCYSLTSVNITDLDKWTEIEFEYFSANPLYYAHNLYLNEELVTEAKMTTVQKIGAYAFYGCSGLKSVTIENSVTSIGEEAFCGCSGMTSVTIPNSVTSIGEEAFYRCSGLKSVNITDLDKWAEIEFESSDANPLYYAHNLYLNGQLVIEAKLTTAKKIESYAFSDCSLTSVTIPNSVTSIGYGAFSYCKGLTSVSISDLDKWAEIEFGSPEANPLYYAHNLYINEQLVTEAKLTTAQKIGDYAFTWCSSLTSVTIPNSVTSIGNSAFWNCSGLTSVEIPNSVTSIGDQAFRNCSSLTSVTIPNSVTIIGIGRNAFDGCSGLDIIANGINAPTIGSSTFTPMKNCSLHVPLGSEEAYATNFGTYFKSGNTYGNTIVPYSTYSKNSAGEYSFEVWDASSDVELSEGADKVYVPVEATVNDLQYKRTFNNTDWQALYVPFELDVKNDLAGFNVYEISTSSADAINVTLITEGKTSANTPYLIKAKATGEQTIPVSSKTVKVTVENTNSDLSDFEIVGTYEKLKYGDIDGDWYALKGGKFMKAGEGAFLNPYRFYLKRKSSSAKESIDINLNEVTGIEAVQSADKRANNGKHYNLQGIEVNENYNGMIIINGKKYLKK